jgi:hypothetical protein
MELLIGWIVGSIIVCVMAKQRGREAIGWFILSMFISPILAILLLLVLEPKNTYEKELARARLRAQVEADLENERRTGKPAGPPRDQFGSFVR